METKLLIKQFVLSLLLLFSIGALNAQVIITQYYEGASSDKYIEITNIGKTSVDLSNYYLGRWSNTDSPASTDPYANGSALSGTIAAGQTLVYMNAGAVNPPYAVTNAVGSTTATYFNGNDPVALLEGGKTWADRVDCIYGPGTWGADVSFYRKGTVTAGNKNMSVLDGTGEWVKATLDEVANASSTESAYLGYFGSGGSDVTAPTWSSGFPNITRTEDTHARAGVKLDEKCKVYFIVVPKGSDQPNLAQVKAGVDYGTVKITYSDSIDVTSPETPFYENVTGLTASTSYDVYMFAIDLAGNDQGSLAGLAINTTAARLLTLNTPKTNDSFNLGDTIKVAWTSANIDSLVISISPVSSMVNVVMTVGTVKASDGVFKFAAPGAGNYTLTLSDVYDTSYKATVSPIAVVDNRSLHLTSPKDNEKIYVGDTAVFKWTSSNVDSVLIGGYMSQGGPSDTGGYFMLTGDPDHFDKDYFKPVAASAGVFKFYLPPDIGGSIKLDSVIIWDAADVEKNVNNPANIHFKSYAAPVYVVDTLPISITSSMPAFGMTGFMPNGNIYANFSCDSIIRGTGNLYLKKADGTVVQTISAADIGMHGSGIDFQPAMSLAPGGYYIEIDAGFVKSADGSKTYKGLPANKWTFTVASGSIYFSEYIEGSSNNKALEIFNPTNADVSLDDYIIAGSYNGKGLNQDGDVYYFPKGTVLKSGDVFVLANSQASPDILAHTNDTLAYNEGGYVCSFNGDDARVLVKVIDNNGHGGNWMWVDAIGTPWEDPGSGWDVAGVSAATKDHTLLRKRSVAIGNGGDWGRSAGTDADNSEWIVKDKNYFGNIGQPTPTSTGISNPSLAENIEVYPNPGDGRLNITLNNVFKGNVTVRIMDITGRQVYRHVFNNVMNQMLPVDISNEPSNLYFITISDAHNTVVKKFMKR